MQVSRITQPARALQLRGHEPDTRLRTRQLASKRAFGKTEQWLRSWGRRADMDPAAPGRNEEERPALIYRNDPEVAKATAAALRAAVVSAIVENTSVSNFRQLSFSPKAKYPTLESLQPLAEESGRSLEARSIAEEGLVGGPLCEDGGGEGRRSVTSGRASRGRSADSGGSSTNLLISGNTRSAGGQYPRGLLWGMADGGHVGHVSWGGTPSATNVVRDPPVIDRRTTHCRLVGQYCQECMVCYPSRRSSPDDGPRPAAGNTNAFHKFSGGW